MHICKLVFATKHAPNTAITSPALIFPSLTSFNFRAEPEPMAMVAPHTAFSHSRTLSKEDCSYKAALKALTVAMETKARSTKVAAVAFSERSEAGWCQLLLPYVLIWMI